MPPSTRKVISLFTIYTCLATAVLYIAGITVTASQYSQNLAYNQGLQSNIILGFLLPNALLAAVAIVAFFHTKRQPIAARLLLTLLSVVLFTLLGGLASTILPELFSDPENAVSKFILIALTSGIYTLGLRAVLPKLTIESLNNRSPYIAIITTFFCIGAILGTGGAITSFMDSPNTATSIFSYGFLLAVAVFVGSLIFTLDRQYRLLYAIITTLAWGSIVTAIPAIGMTLMQTANPTPMMQYCAYIIATAFILATVAVHTRNKVQK